MYIKTSIIRTPLGPQQAVLYVEVSLFQRVQRYTCQCEGCQMRQNNGALLKEVAALQRCPLIDVSL